MSRTLDSLPVNRPASMLATMLAVLLLTACAGSASDPEPTVAPTAAPAPTLRPGAMSVADLQTMIDTAWPAVRSMRTSFWSTEATAGATPPPTGMVTVEDVVLPANRRVALITDGLVTDEQILADGRIYMKGALVPAAIAPQVDTETWVEVDPAAAETGSPVSMQIAYLLSPITPPFGDISDETAALEAVPGGNITINGRSCQVYAFGGAGGIAYELSLDPTGLPCRFVQAAGGATNVTTFEFNDPALTIAPPNLATPPSE